MTCTNIFFLQSLNEVITVEKVTELGARAERICLCLFLDNIHFRIGDGSLRCYECGPFGAIPAMMAPPGILKALIVSNCLRTERCSSREAHRKGGKPVEGERNKGKS
ncbi:MAG: hypothetical protein AB9903_09270 [Vulcanimicrobiota bacterium]